MSWYSDRERFDEYEGCKRCNFSKHPSWKFVKTVLIGKAIGKTIKRKLKNELWYKDGQKDSEVRYE